MHHLLPQKAGGLVSPKDSTAPDHDPCSCGTQNRTTGRIFRGIHGKLMVAAMTSHAADDYSFKLSMEFLFI